MDGRTKIQPTRADLNQISRLFSDNYNNPLVLNFYDHKILLFVLHHILDFDAPITPIINRMKATDGTRSFFQTIIEDGKSSCFMLLIYTKSLEWVWSLTLSATNMECANYTHKSKCLCVLCMPMMFVCVVHANVCGMVVPAIHKGLLVGMW